MKYIKYWLYRIKMWFNSNIYEPYILPYKLRKEYTYTGPGKYEYGPVYVQYMWEKLGEWGEYPDYDKMEELYEKDKNTYLWVNPPTLEEWLDIKYDVYTFPVSRIERRAWPELEDVTKVYMYEDSQGFVHNWEE